MSELDIKLSSELPRPEEGKQYKIISAEDFTSQVRNFPGIRVSMEDKRGNEVVETLWKRPVVGPKSKIGAFILALGKNLRDWPGKKILFVTWRQNNREIQRV